MVSAVFFDVMPCSPLKVFPTIRVYVCSVHLLGTIIRQARNQREGGSKQSLAICYQPMFVRACSHCSQVQRISQARKQETNLKHIA